MPQLAVVSRVPSASLLQNLFIFPSLASVTMYASAGGKTEIMTQGIFSLLLHVSSPQLKHSKLLGAPHLMDCRHFGPCFLNISVDQERWHIHTGSQCFVELFWGGNSNADVQAHKLQSFWENSGSSVSPWLFPTTIKTLSFNTSQSLCYSSLICKTTGKHWYKDCGHE